MNEGTLVTRLTGVLKELPHAVVFKHSDAVTSGIPDISFTWCGFTSWLEVKYVRSGEKSIRGTRLQEDVLRRLRKAGRAFWIVFSDQGVQVIDPISGKILAQHSKKNCLVVREFLVATHNAPLIPEGGLT